MQKVVIDSDIIIDFTRKASTFLSSLLERHYEKEVKLFVSASVVMELMAGTETTNKSKLQDLEEFFNKVQVIPLDYFLASQAGFLIRDYKKLGFADAIVAATVLSLGGKLATRNKKDFQDIKGIKFFNGKN